MLVTLFCCFFLSRGNKERQNDQVGTVMSWTLAGIVPRPCRIKSIEGLVPGFGSPLKVEQSSAAVIEPAPAMLIVQTVHHQRHRERELRNEHISRFSAQGLLICLFI